MGPVACARPRSCMRGASRFILDCQTGPQGLKKRVHQMIRSVPVRGTRCFLAATILFAAACSTSEQGPGGAPAAQPEVAVADQQPSAAQPQDQSGMSEVAARQRALEAKRREVAKAHVTNGRALLEQGRLAEARKEFEDAYNLDLTNAEASHRSIKKS